MVQTAVIANSHPLIFISDARRGTFPEFVEDKLVLATDTMTIVGCAADVDGDATITLGSVGEVKPAEELVFDAVLKTPTKRLVVSIVEDDEVLGADVPARETRIRIWTNRLSLPDEIVIGWGD